MRQLCQAMSTNPAETLSLMTMPSAANILMHQVEKTIIADETCTSLDVADVKITLRVIIPAGP